MATAHLRDGKTLPNRNGYGDGKENQFNPTHAFIVTSLVAQTVKNLHAMQETREDGLERSPKEGNGNPLQYSCLKNSMDKGAW